MQGNPAETRGVTSVVSVVLLVGITVLLATTVGVVALGLGQDVETTAPTTTLETETDDERDRVAFVHAAGETIDSDRLGVKGGEMVGTPPDDVRAGESIEVTPTARQVTLVYEDDGTSYVLAKTTVETAVRQGQVVIQESALTDHNEQCARGDLTDTEFDDPVTVEVELAAAVDDDVNLDVAVKDHLSDCGTPTNGASGSTTVTVEDGAGQFTIEGADTDAGADFDLTLPCLLLGGPCDVNDIDSIVVTADGHTVEKVTVGA